LNRAIEIWLTRFYHRNDHRLAFKLIPYPFTMHDIDPKKAAMHPGIIVVKYFNLHDLTQNYKNKGKKDLPWSKTSLYLLRSRNDKLKSFRTDTNYGDLTSFPSTQTSQLSDLTQDTPCGLTRALI
jgi:hypothetical protein